MLEHDPDFDYDPAARSDIYSRPGCPSCDAVKAELKRHDIRYREIILSTQEERDALYDLIGLKDNKRRVPQIVVDTVRIGGADHFFSGLGMDWTKGVTGPANYSLDQMTPTPGCPEPPRVTLDANGRAPRPAQAPEVVDAGGMAVPVGLPPREGAKTPEVVDAPELALVA